MKPTKEQIKLIEFCKSILNTWINTNDIKSPTHRNDIIDFIRSELEEFVEDTKENIKEDLTNLWYSIIDYEVYED